MDGWIRLWRQSLDSQVFQDRDLWHLWCWCLLKATWKTRWVPIRTGRGSTQIKLEPGQFIFGRKSASEELRIPGSTLARRLSKLNKAGNVSIQPSTHYSIVTIVNWAVFQSGDVDGGQACEQASVTQVSGKCHPSVTNKKDKKEQKGEKEKESAAAESLANHEAEFIELWNKTPGVCRIRGQKLTSKRRSQFHARLRDPDWYPGLREALAKFPLKCTLGDDDPWKPDGDFILQPDSVTKILEGRYDWTKNGDGRDKGRQPMPTGAGHKHGRERVDTSGF